MHAGTPKPQPHQHASPRPHTSRRPAPPRHPRNNDRREQPQKAVTTLKAGPKDRLRIAVLGGCEEVGRNCTMIEYGDDIVIIDMGLHFPE